MLFKHMILLLVLLYSKSIWCYNIDRSINLEAENISNKEVVTAVNTFALPLAQTTLYLHNGVQNGSRGNKFYEKIKDNSKSTIKEFYGNKKITVKRLDVKGNGLAELVEESVQFGELPHKRDLYIYNEFFNPQEYSHLKGNYFNSWFVQDHQDVEQDHVREKRYPQKLYTGDPESQFTSDNIEEYVNLRTGQVIKEKRYALENAFVQLEKDITELARLKSKQILDQNGNKLCLNTSESRIAAAVVDNSNMKHMAEQINDIPKIANVTLINKGQLTTSPSTLAKSGNNLPINEALIKTLLQTFSSKVPQTT